MGAKFPQYSYDDMVLAQYRLVTEGHCEGRSDATMDRGFETTHPTQMNADLLVSAGGLDGYARQTPQPIIIRGYRR